MIKVSASLLKYNDVELNLDDIKQNILTICKLHIMHKDLQRQCCYWVVRKIDVNDLYPKFQIKTNNVTCMYLKKQLDKDCWHVVKLKTTCHWKKLEKTQKVYKSNKAYQKSQV